MTVRFLEPARDEFLRAVEFYEDQHPGLGEKLVAEVETAIEVLENSSRAGAPFGEETRRLVLSHYPFDIVYTVENNETIIIAVAHHRRKPGYWSDRTT